MPSFKDIAMRTDLLDSNYFHLDGVLRVRKNECNVILALYTSFVSLFRKHDIIYSHDNRRKCIVSDANFGKILLLDDKLA